MTNPLLAQPSRRYVLLLTTALWTARYAALVANALFDHGLTPPAVHAAFEGALTSGVGALLCLLMERVLRHTAGTWGNEGIGYLFLLSTAMAVAWTTITRGVIAPILDAFVLLPRNDPETTLAVTFIFFGWAGGWFSVAYAEQLRETTARADRSAARIVELEALLGETKRSEDHEFVSDLWVPTRSGTARLPVTDLVTLTSEREYVRLRTADGTEHLVRASLAALYARLNPALFVQVHRSVVINKNQVGSIDRRSGRGLLIVMINGARLPVGRKYEAGVRQLSGRN